jgi:cystathionine beta-lyase/cystathionine gamma-synthase
MAIDHEAGGWPDQEGLLVSLEDLREDLEELAWLNDSFGDRLLAVYQEIVRAPLPEPVRRFQLRELTRYEALAVKQVRDLSTLRRDARRARPTARNVGRLAHAVRVHAELARTLRGAAAGVATASDWQSPSLDHSMSSAAGRMSGRVIEHHDDYKRDRHQDAAWFERAYLRDYVDRSDDLGLRALMTNCGMSAFTSILAYLNERCPSGPVFLGRGTYHECRDLLRGSRLGPRLEEVDEHDATGIVERVRRVRPSALLLDALCNARGIAVPNLGTILRGIEAARVPIVVVIDTTGLSCAVQPLRWLTDLHGPLRPILFESLTKYPQFGLDRTTAGMIVAPPVEAAALDLLREHLGANVTDSSVHVLPVPNRRRLERRLRRIGRNTELMAERLESAIDRSSASLIESVRYPGLPSHPGHATVRATPFPGGFFEVAFSAEHDEEAPRRRFIGSALAAAIRAGVQLVEGASFGFDTTRIYLTASGEAADRAFVRVSAGTEHLIAAERLAAALVDALAQVEGTTPRLRPVRSSL